MKPSKRKKLEAAGWKVGSASDFLELSDAEEMLVNIKLSLASKVKELRIKRKITQQQFAKLLGSSQSRIAKLEQADRSVSVELLLRSLVTLGASRSQIGKIVGTRSAARRQRKPARAKKRLAKA
ncbi:helix-turn-helix protein [Stieleria bergensis]|uniref:Helix-turn-helix protein n=1 Tax=Stieleria bergensis TaxID=2528025 RepID=A0A517SVM1_9BACT|nr:helix-turn-helix protein [Planctomycetes bacterium SV_7m_r]